MKDHKHESTSVPLIKPMPAPASVPVVPPAPKKKRDVSALYVPASIIIAALIIGAGLFFGLSAKSAGTAAQPGQPVAAEANIKDVDIDGHPFIGKGNAPVVMAYWFDYQCPFCKAFDTGGVPQIPTEPAMPELIKQYVNAGKLKIVFMDYPFLGQDSMDAAEYAHAVWELYPSQFYAWHTAMFKAQDEEGDQGFGDAASIDALIKKSFPQMDAAKLKALIAAKKSDYDAAIQADRAQGSKMGVNGTPGFVVGTTLISGAQPLSSFTSAIDALLK